MIGFILGAIGLDVVTGRLRLTFGSVELMRGMSFIVAVIGLFGLGEILLTVEEGLRFRGRDAAGALPGHGGDVARADSATGGRSCAAR